MVTVHEILSLEDPGARLFTRLTEAQLRAGGAAGLAASSAAGLFIAESPNVIQRGLNNGFEPVAGLCERAQVPWLKDALDGEIPIYTADDQLLRQITGFALTRGVMCAFRRRALPSVEDICVGPTGRRGSGSDVEKGVTDQKARRIAVLDGAKRVTDQRVRRIAVLDGIVDSTNIGAIFRSAAALGYEAVLLTRTCCDPLNRRAVRVSMGAVLQVPWTWLDVQGPHDTEYEGTCPGVQGPRDHEHGGACSGVSSQSDHGQNPSITSRLNSLGFKTVAMALRDDARALDDPVIAREPRLAIVLGNEGDGLSDQDIAQADYVVCIPMAHGVDSLNVSAAAAIAFWQLRP